MKIGLLGGTFDPVHLGHVQVALDVRAALGLDEVWLVCAAVPPHKRNVTPAVHRLAMLRLAVADIPGLVASDIEIAHGFSYSVDTLELLGAMRPRDRFHFIVGHDAYLDIRTWKDWPRLFRLAKFVVVNRAGIDSVIDASDSENICTVEVKSLTISASAVRDAIRDGADVSPFMNREVIRYIEENHLYR